MQNTTANHRTQRQKMLSFLAKDLRFLAKQAKTNYGTQEHQLLPEKVRTSYRQCLLMIGQLNKDVHFFLTVSFFNPG